jgi:hypothetical protein
MFLFRVLLCVSCFSCLFPVSEQFLFPFLMKTGLTMDGNVEKRETQNKLDFLSLHQNKLDFSFLALFFYFPHPYPSVRQIGVWQIQFAPTWREETSWISEMLRISMNRTPLF